MQLQDNRLVLLVGDLNAAPDHPALQLLRDAGYVDLWEKLHPTTSDTPLSITNPSMSISMDPSVLADLGLTFPSHNPIKRIDYGWANQLLMHYISNISVIGDDPNPDGTYASDHLGLLFEFDL